MISNSAKSCMAISSVKSLCKMRFKAQGVSCSPCAFSLPEKTTPVPPLASSALQAKNLIQSLELHSSVGRSCASTLKGFFVQRLLARNHPWLLKRSQKHGKKNLWLSCPLLWLLGPKIVKQTLDRVTARPWALCSMDFSKPF